MDDNKLVELSVVCALWVAMAASYYDGWRHAQPELGHELNTLSGFVGNAAHQTMYGATAFIAIALTYLIYEKWKRTDEASYSFLPKGYAISLGACLLVLIGAVADLLWHILIGVEEIGLSSQLSPPHAIMVFVGSVLQGFGLIIQRWQKGADPSSYDKIVVVLSAVFVVGMMRYLSHTFTPLTHISQTANPALILSLLVQTSLTVGITLILLKKHSLVLGSVFIIMCFSQIANPIYLEKYFMVFHILFGALAGELIYHLVQPRTSLGRFRVFSFLLPLPYASTFFLSLYWVYDIVWIVHVWSGAILASGYTGLLLSYLSIGPLGGKNFD